MLSFIYPLVITIGLQNYEAVKALILYFYIFFINHGIMFNPVLNIKFTMDMTRYEIS